MRFHVPDGRVLQVDRVGGFHTFAARIAGGPWTAWGDLPTVVATATGLDPTDPWIGRVQAYVAEETAAA